MAIRVNIFSFFDPKGINNARKSFSALTDSNVASAKKQAIAMKLVGGAFATAGVAATAFATKIAREGVQAALEDERSLAMLNKTLKNLGAGFQATAVDEFINKLQFTRGIADDELRPALNRLVLATSSVTKSQELLSLALDISAGTGKDLESVTTAIAKAANGQFTALQRLGVGLDKATLETKNLDIITTTLSQKFAGQAVNAADTFAGKLKIISLGSDEAKEAIGYGLLNAIETVAKALGYTADGLAKSLSDTGEELGQFLEEIGYVTAGLIEYAQELTGAGNETGIFSRFVANLETQILKTNPRLQFLIALLEILGVKGREATGAFTPQNATPAQSRILAQQRAVEKEIALQQELADKQEEARKEAEARAKEAQRAAEAEAKALQDRFKKLGNASEDFASKMAGTSPQTVQGSLNQATKSLNDLKNLVSTTKYVTDDTVSSFTELSNVISSNLLDAFNMAKSQLEDAQNAFNDFKNAISTTINGTIDFASAVEETDFLTGLEQQANVAIKFSERVSKLLEMGLSERALQGVLDAGAETGTKIADEIIAGGSSVVNKVNSLLSAVQTVAEKVGLQGANMFYSAGVSQGQALVEGIKASILSATAEISRLTANLLGQKATTTTTSSASEIAYLQSLKPTPGSAASFRIAEELDKLQSARRFADGGIVLGATNAIIGEAGPEAVIPLSGANSPKLGAVYNITVNAGIGTNGPAVGQQIVEAIKKYERTSGQVFARA